MTNTKPKVLITGGAGYIGSHAVLACAHAAPAIVQHLLQTRGI